MKSYLVILSLVFLPGCASVKYNGSPVTTKAIDYPEIGKEVVAFIGDPLLQKGNIVEEQVLEVRNTIDGALYDIPAMLYTQIGHDQNNDYYSAQGVIRGGLADPIQALSLSKQPNSQLCVVTVFGGKACYKGDFGRKTKVSERSDSFQQTLLYSGRVGNKINISYREYTNSYARPAFNNDVEYDLSTSKQIGYKGAQLEVINADNNSITYKVIRNFR